MKILIIIVFLIFGCSQENKEQAELTENESSKITDNGHFRITYLSKTNPIEINQMHAWIINIQDINGENIDQALVAIDGGMPAHNHGLPTQPQMTKNLGSGNYLVEGMKFHMHGSWVVNFSIEANGQSDQVTFQLSL